MPPHNPRKIQKKSTNPSPNKNKDTATLNKKIKHNKHLTLYQQYFHINSKHNYSINTQTTQKHTPKHNQTNLNQKKHSKISHNTHPPPKRIISLTTIYNNQDCLNLSHKNSPPILLPLSPLPLTQHPPHPPHPKNYTQYKHYPQLPP